MNSINEKIVNERTLTVNKILNLDQIQEKKCQMVFVTNTEKENLSTIIQSVKSQPILTFGDMEHFAEKGGSMNFYIANNRLAIMANLASVEKSNLKINDQMLRLITVVPPQS